MEAAEPGWMADPSERHQLRYWDGSTWTSRVSDQRWPSIDELDCEARLSKALAVPGPKVFGFAGRWSSRLATMMQPPRAQALIGGDARLVMVCAALSFTPNGSGTGVVVVSHTEVRSFGKEAWDRSIREPQPRLVVPVEGILSVAKPTFTDTVKVAVDDRSTAQWTLASKQAAKRFSAMLERLASVRPAASGTLFVYIGGSGYGLTEGDRLLGTLGGDGLKASTLGQVRRRLDIPPQSIRSFEIGGPGKVTRGGGYSGGGFGLAGFAVGAATAAGMNALTSKTEIQTLIRITTDAGELNLFTADITPTALDLKVADLRTRLRTSPPVVEDVEQQLTQLERLGTLHQQGVLTDAEFAEQKAVILGRRPS